MAREQSPCHTQSIGCGEIAGKTQAPGVFPDETDIELNVVADQYTSLAEAQKIRQHEFDGFGLDDHTVTDSCELRDLIGNRHLGIDKL